MAQRDKNIDAIVYCVIIRVILLTVLCICEGKESRGVECMVLNEAYFGIGRSISAFRPVWKEQ